MKRLRIFTATPSSDIDSYDLLCDYSWVDAFLKSLEIQKQVLKFKNEQTALNAAPITLASFRDRLKVDFARVQKSRVEWLKNLIGEHVNSLEPLATLPSRMINPIVSQKLFPFLSWEEVEKALLLIPEKQGAISLEAKETKLLQVEKQLAELKTEMATLSPEIYFKNREGRIVADVRETFVQGWWDLQARMAEACSPFGRALKFSGKSEQKAWQKLLIDAAVNPYARLLPAQENG